MQCRNTVPALLPARLESGSSFSFPENASSGSELIESITATPHSTRASQTQGFEKPHLLQY